MQQVPEHLIPSSIKDLDEIIKDHIRRDSLSATAVALNIDTAIILATGGNEELVRSLMDITTARIVEKCRAMQRSQAQEKPHDTH